jgi:energy-coupling factor transporter ATP-binding protein EcfA2
MYKGIVASDLHLDSHPKRTPTRDFRLKQSFIVVDNIINLAKREGAKNFLFLAGDIVDKHDHDSTTHHVVKECLQRLADFFDEVYFILGNHDILNRSVSAESREGDLKFSYITLYKPEKFVYADRMVLEREGVRIGFRNHTSAAELDLSFLEGNPVDILVTHISRAYSEKCDYEVQRYSDDLVRGNLISGHIHQSKCLGKDVSIGVGQKCSISDDVPQALVLEINQGSYRFKHEILDPEKKQMDIVPDLTISTDFYDEATNTYHVAKKDEEKIAELVASSLRGGTAIETLNKYVEVKGIGSLFEEIKAATNLDDSGPLNMDFQITSLRIHNLRSIKDQEFEFKPSDFIRIDGETGSGKSTVFLALQYALTGELGGPKAFFIRHGEKEMWTELELDYQGKHYKIRRGTGESFIEENGIRLELGNKNDTKKKIYEILPFIKALGFMCFDRESHIVKGGSSSENSEKLQSFCRIIGLTEIDAYHKTAESMYKPVEQKLITEKAVYESKYSGISDKRAKFEVLLDRHGNSDMVNSKIAQLGEEYKKLKNNLSEYQKDQDLRRQYQYSLDRVKSEESKLEGLENQLSGYQGRGDYSKKKFELEARSKEVKEKLKVMSEDQVKKINLETKLRSMYDLGTSMYNELQNLKPEEAKFCSSYGVVCPIITEEMRMRKYEETKKALQERLNSHTLEYNKTQEEYHQIEPRLQGYSDLQNQDQEITRELMALEHEQRTIDSLTLAIKEQRVAIERAKSMIPMSLGEPVELLPNITERISELQEEQRELQEYKRIKEELDALENESGDLELEIIELQKKLEELDVFLKLTKPNGVVYTDILDNIVKSFSNGRYRYEVESNRAKSGIEIRAYIKDSKGNETPYGIGSTGSSSGEGVMIDLHFLSCLVSIASPGLMIFDEFLSPLDINLIDEGIQRVKDMKAKLTFVVAHQNNLRQGFNRVFICSKDSNETSRYEEN